MRQAMHVCLLHGSRKIATKTRQRCVIEHSTMYYKFDLRIHDFSLFYLCGGMVFPPSHGSRS